MMPLQRACHAESQARNKLSNGPLRVQSNASFRKVFCNVWAYVSCRGYAGIPLSARVHAREFKVAPRIVFTLFVLDRNVYFCQGLFTPLTVTVKGVFLFWRYRP